MTSGVDRREAARAPRSLQGGESLRVEQPDRTVARLRRQVHAPRTPPALSVRLVRRQRITHLIAEIALERGNLIALDRKVFHVPEHFALLGPANVLHEHLVSLAKNRLELKPIDKRVLRVPTSRFKHALADVI